MIRWRQLRGASIAERSHILIYCVVTCRSHLVTSDFSHSSNCLRADDGSIVPTRVPSLHTCARHCLRSRSKIEKNRAKSPIRPGRRGPPGYRAAAGCNCSKLTDPPGTGADRTTHCARCTYKLLPDSRSAHDHDTHTDGARKGYRASQSTRAFHTTTWQARLGRA